MPPVPAPPPNDADGARSAPPEPASLDRATLHPAGAGAPDLVPGEPMIGSAGMADGELAAPSGEVDEEADRERQLQTRKIVREVVETVLLALLVFLAVRAGLQNFRVEGFSMHPTLENGQHILVNRLIYAEIDTGRLADAIPFFEAEEGARQQVFGGPERGDIIVFRGSANGAGDLIKRVIGLPGEQVEILDGRVYIDGHLLEESYITTPWHDTREAIVIPERHYYVLGDNRNSSQDSRSRGVGLVPRDRIVGKALLTYWPFGMFGLAPNGGAELAETPDLPEAAAAQGAGARAEGAAP